MADFQSLQTRFAAHLRDPDTQPAPPGIDDRRLGIYRDLFFNNVRGLLAGNFPVLRSLHDDASWRALVRAWYREHRAHTPLFPMLGGEFVQWLQNNDAVPDWQAELAHYEWMETVAANDEADLADIAHDPGGDLLDGYPLLSPLVRPLRYRYPVHRIRADAIPDTAPAAPTCLVIVRDRQDRVGFLEANPLTLALVEHLREAAGRRTGRELLEALADAGGIDPIRMVGSGTPLFLNLRSRDILLGTMS